MQSVRVRQRLAFGLPCCAPSKPRRQRQRRFIPSLAEQSPRQWQP